MKIRFMGLITHALVNSKDVAVLFNDPDHEPRLIVRKKFIDGNSDTNDTVECFDLTGRIVSFSGFSGAVNRSGLSPLPRLSKIGGGAGIVRKDVKNRTTGGVFTAFVELAGGDYGIDDFFQNQGTLDGTTFDCIPRTVKFEPSTSATTDVIGLAKPLKLKPNAVILISNLENKVTPPHFDRYENFFDPKKTLTVPKEHPTKKCLKGSPPNVPKCPKEPKQFVSVECSNTSYP